MIRAVRGDEDAWLERVFPDGVLNCTRSVLRQAFFCERAHRLYFLFLICLVILMVAAGHHAHRLVSLLFLLGALLAALLVVLLFRCRSFCPIAPDFLPFTVIAR
jgi:Flp pilus assembly protein TadB